MKKDARNTQYQSARDAFDDLKIEDKAVFLVEATVSTLARGLEDAAKTLADEFDGMFRPRAHADAPSDAPGPAEPETAKAKASRTRAKKTTAKTTAKKSTATKKKTTARRPPRKDAGDEDAA